MTLKEAVDILARAGIENARNEARMIFRDIGNVRDFELTYPEFDITCEAVENALKRRAAREPLQYIIGHVDFYKERYDVTPDCLIPRSDTEILVDFAVNNIPSGARFADVCCGSGCIGISVLKNTKETEAVAIDISEKAVELTKRNAVNNGVSERLELICADALTAVTCGEFFAVLSNPPYVTDEAYGNLAPEIYAEPKIAFVGGEDGADFYRALTPIYKDKIVKNGFIAYEIGYDQEKLICEIAEKNGMSCEILHDFSGNPRVAILRHF